MSSTILEEAADTLTSAIAIKSGDTDEAAKQLASVMYNAMAQLGTCPHCVIRDVTRLMQDELVDALKDESTPVSDRQELMDLLTLFGMHATEREH